MGMPGPGPGHESCPVCLWNAKHPKSGWRAFPKVIYRCPICDREPKVEPGRKLDLDNMQPGTLWSIRCSRYVTRASQSAHDHSISAYAMTRATVIKRWNKLVRG